MTDADVPPTLEPPSPELLAAAAARGVMTAYIDAGGATRQVSAATLRAVLDALGPAPDPDAPPVVLAWDGTLPDYQVRLPAGTARAEVVFGFEDGTARSWRALAEPDPDGGAHAVATVRMPGTLPHGLHTVEVVPVEPKPDPANPSAPVRTTVIAAPRRAWRPDDVAEDARRRTGVFVPLYALHTADSVGAGNLTDLAALGERLAARRLDLVQTLPILAGRLDEPAVPSPYMPVSRLHWNELVLDLRAVPEVVEDDFAAEADELAFLRSARMVDHARQAALQRRILTAALDRVDGDRAEAFARHLAAYPGVLDYAAFRSDAERYGRNPAQWPVEVRGRGPRDVDLDAHGLPFDPATRYHAWVQFLAEEQVAQTAGRLGALDVAWYLDLPIGVDPWGYDAWRWGDLHVSGMHVGAPPDSFFAHGQDWTFPPLHPDRSRADGHRFVAATLAHQMRVASMLRIDHVMGLHRLYWIPEQMAATEGTYVTMPGEELYALVCLLSHRYRCRVVGEDLGTVPGEVDAAMRSHELVRMSVVEYDLGADPPHLGWPEANTVAGINTHDMPTWQGFWVGDDIADRVDLGQLAPDAVAAEHAARQRKRDEAVRFVTSAQHPPADPADAGSVLDSLCATLAGSPALARVLALEDAAGVALAQNTPGTDTERPNWIRRLPDDLDALLARDDVARRLELLRGSDEVAPLSADDRYLFGEGNHFTLWERLGAHPSTHDGVDGIRFAVWAPNAREVSVFGDFCGWNPDAHPLRPVEGSGIWSGFVPGLGLGEIYKFRIISHNWGQALEKADPFAFRAEVAPRTASVTATLEFDWADQDWMAGRHAANRMDAPISIYEVHLGSWRRRPDDGNRSLSYRELAPELIGHVQATGFTHVEFLPVMEHPFFGSWGYQSTGYFAPTSRYGSPQDLMWLIDELHRHGIGVIMDWVPSHFPADAHGLANFDGTHLFEHADPREGWHPDWNSAIFNYGRNEVRSFLISSALFWLDAYHADGLRVDGVASMLYRDYSREAGEWIPNVHGGRENLEAIAFLRRLNEEVYRRHPDSLTIAEESTAWPGVSRPTYVGGLGFGFKWDMGWMHDVLGYLSLDPVYRRWHHHEATFRMIYAWDENFVLSLSHDEVVHGKGSLLRKMPGDDWQKFANLRALYGFQWTLPGKKLLFMGGEFAQWDEWNHDGSLDWHLLDFEPHRGVQRWIGDLNAAYRTLAELHELDCDPAGFEWVDAGNAEQSVLAFLRWGKDRSQGPVLVVANFTPGTYGDFRVGVPCGGWWREVVNSDNGTYGGAGSGNYGGVHADAVAAHGRDWSLNITVPPLGVVVFRREG